MYCLWTRRSMVNYSCIIGGAPMRMMNPSMIVFPLRQGAGIGLQIGSHGSGTCGGWNCVSSTPLGFLEYLESIKARQGPLARPSVLLAPHASPSSLPWLPSCFLGRKKSPKSFMAFVLHLVLIFCEVKTNKEQQLALGTMSIGQSQKMI